MAKKSENRGSYMIVMINGAFGVGKSSAAKQLVNHIPNAMIYDPEEVGLMLRNIIPDAIRLEAEKTEDFQDFELWRVLVVQIAQQIVNKYKCSLVVPMTLKNKVYFDYIYKGLQHIDENIHCFCLTASIERIHKRLEERGDKLGSWAYNRTEDCLSAYSSDYFGEHIDTENISIKDTVDYILGKIGLV
jgi:deoxyadenosine/deoxycytidine kinase